MGKPNIDEIRNFLSYDAETGLFTWEVRRGRVPAGATAGTMDNKGYIAISFLGVRALAHRIAWFYVYGHWPVSYIDHIDGNRSNNRISNLRCVSMGVNNQNLKSARSDNVAGLLGVSRHGRGFRAVIHLNNKQHYLGIFDTAEEAHSAYLWAKRNLHVGCTI